MATESVATPAPQVTDTAWLHTEPSPFERNCARLNGLKGQLLLARCAMESESQPTTRMWLDVFYGLEVLIEDIRRDMMLQGDVVSGFDGRRERPWHS